MVWRALKVALLELAHLAWSLYTQLVAILVLLHYHLLSSLEEANKTHDQIADDHHHHQRGRSARDLRLPKHIALCFTNEASRLDLESIARLICWCKQLGVAYVTLYDDPGRLKDHRGPLIGHVETRLRALGYEKPISRIEGLTILSRQDGRQRFVEDIRELVRSGPASIDLERVNQRVACSSMSCDPELLVSFGSPLCLYGFPPWQLRLTEILSIPSHRKLPQRVFLDCLRRYSTITQREGV